MEDCVTRYLVAAPGQHPATLSTSISLNLGLGSVRAPRSRTLTKSATFHQSACDESEELLYPRLSVTHKARAVQRLNDTMKRSPKKGRADNSDQMPGLLGHPHRRTRRRQASCLAAPCAEPQEEFNQKQSIHATSPFEVTVLGGGRGSNRFSSCAVTAALLLVDNFREVPHLQVPSLSHHSGTRRHPAGRHPSRDPEFLHGVPIPVPRE